MFKDLKEYQEITQIYNDSVNISEEQREINKIFIEERNFFKFFPLYKLTSPTVFKRAIASFENFSGSKIPICIVSFLKASNLQDYLN